MGRRGAEVRAPEGGELEDRGVDLGPLRGFEALFQVIDTPHLERQREDRH
ncbi:MAG: hypothetical protein GY835_09195 [bacterium]|nr:hypothetical protein [bacterium]